eukprot:TRINITY_DN26159_c0_g1_i1.p1 TRINITY_DN26159_c0_g1~~TRINITY_DN26159_c0_g1_i1.p1  ORF type:complete len:198 (-),score=27.44 TRINITY_DN26159_c0_g1_i1:20-613(-)
MTSLLHVFFVVMLDLHQVHRAHRLRIGQNDTETSGSINECTGLYVEDCEEGDDPAGTYANARPGVFEWSWKNSYKQCKNQKPKSKCKAPAAYCCFRCNFDYIGGLVWPYYYHAIAKGTTLDACVVRAKKDCAQKVLDRVLVLEEVHSGDPSQHIGTTGQCKDVDWEHISDNKCSLDRSEDGDDSEGPFCQDVEESNG